MYDHIKEGQRKFWLLLVQVMCILLVIGCRNEVVGDNQQTFIIDRTGEKWDISQAVTLGFLPKHFEFGLGRNAFTPLDDVKLSDESNEEIRSSTRVIGIGSGEGEAKAYSVNKLSGHEIANSIIGNQPVAAAY